MFDISPPSSCLKQKNSSPKHKSTDRPRASAPVGGLLGWLAGERGPEHRKSTVSSRAKDNSDRRHEPSSASASKGKQPVRSAEGYQAEKPEREGHRGHRLYAHTPANPPRPVHSGSQVQVKNAPTSSAVGRTQAGHSNVYAQKALTPVPSNLQTTRSGAHTRLSEPLMSGAHQAQHQPSSVTNDNSEESGYSANSSTVGICGSKIADRGQASPAINENGDESGFSATFSTAAVYGSSLEARVQTSPEFSESGNKEGLSATFSTAGVWGSKVADRDELRSDEESEESEEVFVYYEASDQDSDIGDSDPNSVFSSDVPAGVQVGASITNADRP